MLMYIVFPYVSLRTCIPTYLFTNGLLMSQTKTCHKCCGVMKLENEIQREDIASEITPLDRTYVCDCGHMEVET
jgi:hypothetical protein